MIAMQSKRTLCGVAIAVGLLVVAQEAASSENLNERKPLTIAASIELTLPLQVHAANPASRESAVQRAPDGTHYVAVFYQGDIAHNGSWVTLVYGNTASLEAASHLDTSLKLFTTANVPLREWINGLRWLDAHERIAFLWDDGKGAAQVLQVNLRTHETQRLTNHPTAVTNFDISQDGETLVYAARAPAERDAAALKRKQKFTAEGFTVTDQTVWSLLKGDFDGWTPNHSQVFILNLRTGTLRPAPDLGLPWAPNEPQSIKISPDGKYCVLDHRVVSLPPEWAAYTDPWLRQSFSAAQKDLQGNSLLRQELVLDLETAELRPLWSAPLNPFFTILWSDNSHIVMGPTYLPVDHSDTIGLAGTAMAEVDVKNGSHRSFPISSQDVVSSGGHGYAPVRVRRGIYEFGRAQDGSGSVALRFKGVGTSGEPVQLPQIQDAGSEHTRKSLRIEVIEDMNTPPALYVVESQSGKKQKIYDPNPGILERYAFANTEIVHWRAAGDIPWSGLLYYPVNYVAGKRYPLVIHTHGYITNSFAFSLSGGHTTAYAAQALANRGIAVLCLRFPDKFEEQGLWAKYMNTPREPKTVQAGVESALDYLKKGGLIEGDKVGLVGFSRTGWYVEYILTHSAYPFAAAISADMSHYDYNEYMFAASAARSGMENAIGARPYGEGLSTWLRESVGFNADKVHTPLRLEQDTDYIWGVLGTQEIFSNLQYLDRPVEDYFIPGINEAGAHPLVSPLQRLASQGGSVDWFDFWLNGREDPSPAKADQYRRWEKLCDLQTAQNRPTFCGHGKGQ
jgi:dipeptidyl aminopeptidase/acylaminoacyl peptidase